MNELQKEKKIRLKDIFMLQGIIMVYSISSVVAKLASAQEFLSFRFLLFYGMEIGILGVYAILWQQAIKKFELSIAYANRAMVMLWALVWAVLIFGERITVQNAIGLVLITLGTIIVNREEKENE
ncbi:MAG: DMT family transporter [Clostridiales bacterium]|nr:DMT family transporter [Clostridiales bacterium]